MSDGTRRASRDLIIFGVTVIACAIGACVGIVAVNLTGSRDEPRPTAEITPGVVRDLADALEEIRPADLEPDQREAVADVRDVLESIEAGDTVIVTPTAPPPPRSTTTAPPVMTGPPATTRPEEEVHDDHRTGPLVTLYPPTTTEAAP